jgi:multimeric flavodoxin WrbA
MKITTLLGSARKEGSTATVLSWIEDELISSGHNVSHIYLNAKVVRACLGCGKCREYPENIACVQKDDAQKILEQMISSDAVLFASPIYFWGFSAQMKALIDRTYSLVAHFGEPGHSSLMAGKRIALLVTGADEYEDNAEGMSEAFRRIGDYFLTPNLSELYIGNCLSAGDLTEDARRDALKLARFLVDKGNSY